MIIKWLGHSAFLVVSDAKLVIDPYDPSIAKLPDSLTADVVTISHNHFDHNFSDGVQGNPRVIDMPGEFDIAGFHIHGISSFHDNEQGAKRGSNIIYVLESNGFRLCHLGDLGQTLSDEQVGAIGSIDVLMVPVGGYYTIGAAEAKTVVEQLMPAVVLPMHYKQAGFTPDNLPIAPVNDFLRILGWPVTELQELSLTPYALSGHKVVKLNISK